MPLDLVIKPEFAQWPALLPRVETDELFGYSLKQWFQKTRAELGLDEQRPIVATGHQTLLWHPGILVKYLTVEALAKANSLARANLIVDQHADEFGDFSIPVRRADGSIIVRRMHLTTPRKGVPMGLHEPFTPPRLPSSVSGMLPSVEAGVKRIYESVYAHRDAPNAARQMGRALSDLMQPWVKPMPSVTATDLLETTFAREILQKMADDPWSCAEDYNRVVKALPEAGVGPLLIRDDYVELPLWRIRDDGRRMHAYDHDVQNWIERGDDGPKLMPRALLLTALVRLGMCDLFVHGMGGANYDRAMERWIKSWLGVKPSSIAMATATLRLPLIDDEASSIDLQQAQNEYRSLWHDPDRGGDDAHPSDVKQELLRRIEATPYGTAERRAAFYHMHRTLETHRTGISESLHERERLIEQSRIMASNESIARRRDWAFPLYESAQLDALADDVDRQLRGVPRKLETT